MELVKKHNVKDYLPPQSGWYDTNEGNIYFFVKEQEWSSRDDRISEEYPVWWLSSFDASENTLPIDSVRLSLRDVFANDAMNALTNRLATPEGYANVKLTDIAKEAYDMADAMIEARGNEA
jgi:hypothetical protein